MSELKVYSQCYDGTDGLFYLKSEADEVIDELKVKLRVQTSNAEDAWKLKDSYHSSYAEAVKELYEKKKEIAQLQAMLEERNKQIGELKDRIAPKQSDKSLQERLNEVCKKYGVSTLQDLDWAFCEEEKRHKKDNIEAAKEINHHKYKRCLAMAEWCKRNRLNACVCGPVEKIDFWEKWHERWLELAEKFKPNNKE